MLKHFAVIKGHRKIGGFGEDIAGEMESAEVSTHITDLSTAEFHSRQYQFLNLDQTFRICDIRTKISTIYLNLGRYFSL